jgi:hypothetical protein
MAEDALVNGRAHMRVAPLAPDCAPWDMVPQAWYANPCYKRCPIGAEPDKDEEDSTEAWVRELAAQPIEDAGRRRSPRPRPGRDRPGGAQPTGRGGQRRRAAGGGSAYALRVLLVCGQLRGWAPHLFMGAPRTTHTTYGTGLFQRFDHVLEALDAELKAAPDGLAREETNLTSYSEQLARPFEHHQALLDAQRELARIEQAHRPGRHKWPAWRCSDRWSRRRRSGLTAGGWRGCGAPSPPNCMSPLFVFNPIHERVMAGRQRPSRSG